MLERSLKRESSSPMKPQTWFNYVLFNHFTILLFYYNIQKPIKCKMNVTEVDGGGDDDEVAGADHGQ